MREQDDLVNEVKYPGLRSDIIDALGVLATITPATLQQWPGLTEAIHWLVDDTFWDKFDPANSIGYKLRDEKESTAIKTVLEPLLVILDELGPIRADGEYLDHHRWPDVAAAARAAHELLTSQDA